LLASDFDQTLSFHDSGQILADMLGVPDFRRRVEGLERIHLVQQGGELAYLILHDPDFRCVRKEHLIEAGRQVRLKSNIALLPLLLNAIDGHQFSFHVVSAAPEEVVISALEGIVAPEHIHATRFRYDDVTGEIESVVRVPAGYGKVAVLDYLQTQFPVGHECVIYVGDGSSDVNVMLHVNRLDGLTIAVSENRYIMQIARRTILSDDVLTVAVPILEEALGWDSLRIRTFFSSCGFTLRDWDKVRTDTITLCAAEPDARAMSAGF
jgi:2-hydroxy-3-keto-5-methylthiopentenyl-1-phosphate phosphatase